MRQVPPRLVAGSGCAWACIVLAGCPSPSAPIGLPQGGSFQHDPSCTLDDALTIALGDGSDGFAPLAVGVGPIEHHGPQGGTHSFVGVRIGNLALDRYDVVLLELSVFAAAQCPTVGAPCDGYPEWGQGRWVLGDETALEPVDEHTIEQNQLVTNPGYDAVVLQAQVEDPCGQVGLAQHPFSR